MLAFSLYRAALAFAYFVAGHGVFGGWEKKENAEEQERVKKTNTDR